MTRYFDIGGITRASAGQMAQSTQTNENAIQSYLLRC